LWLAGVLLAAVGFAVLAGAVALAHLHLYVTLPVAAGAAALGVALGSLGVLVVRRQDERMRLERMRREDRLRRVRAYREAARHEPYLGEGGRREPFIRRDAA
jgi:hypothetical protein